MSETSPRSAVSSPPRQEADFYVASTLRRRIEEDLEDERVAIKTLRDLLPYLASDDPSARPLMEAMLANEETHADELSNLLDGIRR